MNDTSDEIRKKQYEIIFKMTEKERFEQGLEMISFGRLIVENSIKQNNPHLSEVDFKIEVFKRYYKNDFSLSEMENIKKAFYKYHNVAQV